MSEKEEKVYNNDNTLSQGLKEVLEKNGDKISQAERVRSLLQKQKGFLRKKQSLTDFQEPVLFFIRRSGAMELYEKATQGKFTFTHSNGQERFLELRPSDQLSFDYANRKVRAYMSHEDRPFAGFENPIVDGETVMLGYEKTKATDLKYQEAIQRLKNKSKMGWVWIILGIAGAIALVIFAISSFAPDLWDRIFKTGEYAVKTTGTEVPTVGGLILFGIKKNKVARYIKNKLQQL